MGETLQKQGATLTQARGPLGVGIWGEIGIRTESKMSYCSQEGLEGQGRSRASQEGMSMLGILGDLQVVLMSGPQGGVGGLGQGQETRKPRTLCVCQSTRCTAGLRKY